MKDSGKNLIDRAMDLVKSLDDLSDIEAQSVLKIAYEITDCSSKLEAEAYRISATQMASVAFGQMQLSHPPIQTQQQFSGKPEAPSWVHSEVSDEGQKS